MVDVNWMHQQAQQCMQTGQVQQAEAWYRQIVQQAPNHGELHVDWGVSLYQLGRVAEAEMAFRRAAELSPRQAKAFSNWGVCLQRLGRIHDSVQVLQHAINLDPKFADAYSNLGNSLSTLGKHQEAIQCHRRSVEINPEFALGYSNLGNSLKILGKLDESLKAHQRGVELAPTNANLLINLGTTLQTMKRWAEAEQIYRRAIAANPNIGEAYCNLAGCLLEQDKVDEALGFVRHSLALVPTLAMAHQNLALGLRRKGLYDETVAALKNALAILPANSDLWLTLADTYYLMDEMQLAGPAYEEMLKLPGPHALARARLGMVRCQTERFQEAEEEYRLALQEDPNCSQAHWNRAWLYLLLGNWLPGWEDYEWRGKLELKFFPRSPRPLWDGKASLEGKTLFLAADQGIGDTFMVLRYAPQLKQRGARVLIGARRNLHPLLKRQVGVDAVVGEGDPFPEHDFFLPVMSLPHRFQTTIENVPRPESYMTADPDLVAVWKDRLANHGGLKVGIAWQGKPSFVTDLWRSIPLSAYAPLAHVSGISLISLQKGLGEEQIPKWPGPAPIIQLGANFDEGNGAFMDTAAVLKNLDVFITSDSAIAHLAGALGVRTWLALGPISEWRWLLNRSDSPWYPSMRLFRQSRRKIWSDVFEEMASELKKLKS